MIRDLEQHLLSIQEPASRAYMREAVQCYQGAAYRAAVVLAVAAGMDGLRDRLRELATSGGAPPSVLTASKNIEKRFTAQEAFESDLIDAAEKDANFFTPAEGQKARLLLKTRHLCAHPSGHVGSPEEARDAITAVIDLVLSRSATLGMSGVTTLIGRLNGPMFFPKAGDRAHAQTVVSTELTALHPNITTALVIKLLDAVTGAAAAGAATPAARNALEFLVAMVGLGGPRAAVWRYVDRLVQDAHGTEAAHAIISADPAGLALTPPLVRERLIATVRRGLAAPVARAAASAMATAGVLSADERAEFVAVAESTVLGTSVANAKVMSEVLRLGLPEVEAEFQRRLVEECSSSTWEIANRAIDFVQGLSADDAARITRSTRVGYLFAIAEQASRTLGARSAKRLTQRGLDDRSDFIDALIAASAVDRPTWWSADTNWDTLRALCVNSGRADVYPSLVDVWDGATVFSTTALSMLEEIAAASTDPLAGRAQDARDRLHAIMEAAIADDQFN